jgi:hypothetical protein
MNEEDLELLVTLDDPEGEPEEDTFHGHDSVKNEGHKEAQDPTCASL